MRLVPDDACGEGSVFMASTFVEELFLLPAPLDCRSLSLAPSLDLSYVFALFCMRAAAADGAAFAPPFLTTFKFERLCANENWGAAIFLILFCCIDGLRLESPAPSYGFYPIASWALLLGTEALYGSDYANFTFFKIGVTACVWFVTNETVCLWLWGTGVADCFPATPSFYASMFSAEAVAELPPFVWFWLAIKFLCSCLGWSGLARWDKNELV